MRKAASVILMAACAAVGQLPKPLAINPQRISAEQIQTDGDVTHYRGNIAFQAGGVEIRASGLDYSAGEWQFRTRGGVRVTLTRPLGEYVSDPLDPSRFQADQITRDGERIVLHGNAKLLLPNWQVGAQDAVIDRMAGAVTINGDAIFMALKSMVTDGLGPMFITSNSTGAGPQASAGR